MVESLLDDVPGLGEVRRRVLLRHFGSLKRLRAASAADIAELPGFGPRSAASIVAVLSSPAAAAVPGVNTATGEIMETS
jgi:excinuclease ABC subunit C